MDLRKIPVPYDENKKVKKGICRAQTKASRDPLPQSLARPGSRPTVRKTAQSMDTPVVQDVRAYCPCLSTSRLLISLGQKSIKGTRGHKTGFGQVDARWSGDSGAFRARSDMVRGTWEGARQEEESG